MFNPNRNNPRALHNQRRQPTPGAGISHASIMNKYKGPSSVPAGDRKPTATGWSIPIFECEAFATRFEYVFQSSNGGQIVNKQDDRTIYVLAGTVFVTTIEDGKEPHTVKLLQGAFFNVPAGTRYELATGGSEGAELLINESLLYGMHVEQLTQPMQGVDKTDFVELTAKAEPVRRVRNEQAAQNQLAAYNEASSRRERMKGANGTGQSAFSANVNSIGVNPMPGGIPRED